MSIVREVGCQCTMFNNQQNEIRAGFFVRLAAYCVDMLIISTVMGVFKTPFFILNLMSPNNITARGFIFDYSIQDILFYCLQVAYFIVLTYKTGSTIGKKLFRLRVVSEDSETLNLVDVIYRETIGRFLSALVLFVGYFMIGLQEDKKGLHDILSDTKVIYDIKQMTNVEVKSVEPVVDDTCNEANNDLVELDAESKPLDIELQ